jgi:hypothetical protein
MVALGIRHQMIKSWRELLWAIAALAIAVVIAYGLVLLTPHEAQSEPRVFEPSVYEDRILELDAQAIDEAYKKHVMLLFENWVKDVKGQPGRALKGIDSARKAYVDSMTAIDARRAKAK